MNQIPRSLQLPARKTFFLFGPRQTGKSTLLGKSFGGDPHSLSYDLLRADTSEKLIAHPEVLRMEVEAALKRSRVSRLIIDEIQKAPGILDEVHGLIEKHKELPFALSGSSARKLKRMRANMLGGRAWTLHLFPLTTEELGDEFDLQRALRFGSLPSVWHGEDDRDRGEILRSYVETYIHEEIEVEAQVRNLGSFLRFLPLAASQNGAQVNFLNIAREIGISRDVVRGYYQILEDTLLGFFVLPFTRSVRAKLARHPKFYFFDRGVVRAIRKKLSAPLQQESEEFGHAFEHFMLCEIMRLNDYHRLELDISFYRTRTGAEVDCVCVYPTGRVLALEFKSTRSPSRSHCAGLRSFKENVPDAECVLACRIDRPVQLGPFTARPWQDVLRELHDTP